MPTKPSQSEAQITYRDCSGQPDLCVCAKLDELHAVKVKQKVFKLPEPHRKERNLLRHNTLAASHPSESCACLELRGIAPCGAGTWAA